MSKETILNGPYITGAALFALAYFERARIFLRLRRRRRIRFFLHLSLISNPA